MGRNPQYNTGQGRSKKSYESSSKLATYSFIAIFIIILLSIIF